MKNRTNTIDGIVFVHKSGRTPFLKSLHKVVADHFMKNTMSKVKGSFLGPFSFLGVLTFQLAIKVCGIRLAIP